jgi:hypothetical protein
LVSMNCPSTYNVFQVVTTDQVSNSLATFALVGMVAFQTPLGGAGNGEEAENGENGELHCALSGR